MKPRRISAGDQVVLNDAPDATIYFVERIWGFRASIYEVTPNNRRIEHNDVDVSCLRHPTLAQLQASRS